MALTLKLDIFIEESPNSDALIHYTTVYADTEEQLTKLADETPLPKYYYL